MGQTFCAWKRLKFEPPQKYLRLEMYIFGLPKGNGGGERVQMSVVQMSTSMLVSSSIGPNPADVTPRKFWVDQYLS